VDDKKVINTSDRAQVGKIAYLYDNPEMQIKRTIETINVSLL